jgi:hypothetical protein
MLRQRSRRLAQDRKEDGTLDGMSDEQKPEQVLAKDGNRASAADEEAGETENPRYQDTDLCRAHKHLPEGQPSAFDFPPVIGSRGIEVQLNASHK